MKFEDIYSDQPKEIIKIAHLLRKITKQIHPEISEDIYGGAKVKMALYAIGRKDNPLLGIALGKDHCKVYLHHFDKINLHHLKLEGKGKHSRHLKLRSTDEVDESIFSDIFQSIFAIAQAKI